MLVIECIKEGKREEGNGIGGRKGKAFTDRMVLARRELSFLEKGTWR